MKIIALLNNKMNLLASFIYNSLTDKMDIVYKKKKNVLTHCDIL